jgi:threonine dehydratase
MPAITPKLKIKSVQRFGGEWLDIILIGNNFDDAVAEARKFEKSYNAVFIHAFDNLKVIEGQGGLAAEIL